MPNPLDRMGRLLSPMFVVGLLCLGFGLMGLSTWWWSFAELWRGLGPILALLFGIAALASGVSELRSERDQRSRDPFDIDL